VTDAPDAIRSVSVAVMDDGKMLLETKFFVKTSPTEVTFRKDEKGNVVDVIVKSGPRPDMKLKKVKWRLRLGRHHAA
jgi:hypothetical protein